MRRNRRIFSFASSLGVFVQGLRVRYSMQGDARANPTSQLSRRACVRQLARSRNCTRTGGLDL
jgi:hypothetical protein